MTIQVLGEATAARTLRGYLASLGYQTSGSAVYTIRMEQTSGGNPAVEGIRGPLAEEVLHAIAELTEAPVEWRKVSQGSEREVCVVTNGYCDDAVERGVLRAVLKLTGHGSAKTKSPGPGWIRSMLRQKE